MGSEYETFRENVLKLYQEEKDINEIAAELNEPRYLVEAVLVEKHRIHFA